MADKASIITFHCVPNYGAVLQAYGLQQYLKQFFDHVEVVDYQPDSLTKEYRYINFYSIFSIAASLISLPTYHRKVSKFKRFMAERLNTSKESGKTAAQLGQIDSDFVVLGSDQIWNSQILGGLDPVYFGQLQWKKTPYLISYAASIGKKTLTPEEETLFQKLLLLIDQISVRESEANELLASMTDQKIDLVVDPTILAGEACFRSFVRPNTSGRYILLYSLTNNPDAVLMAKQAAQYLQLPIIEITGKRKGIGKAEHKIIYTAGPEEFVSLIANAEFVVTDSFHGTAFSLLFHKRFVSIPHKTRGGRLHTLLQLSGQLSRLTDRFSEELFDAAIDWETVDRLLNTARQASHQYLQDAVNNANKQFAPSKR